MVSKKTSRLGLVRWVAGLSLLALAGASAASCVDGEVGGNAGDAESNASASGAGSGASQGGGACSSDGAKEECHQFVARQEDGYMVCAHGTKTCSGGKWLPCEAHLTSIRPDPRQGGPGYNAQGLSNAAPCTNNPCDPSCMTYDENPPNDGGIMPDGSVITDNWDQGQLPSYPPGLQSKGKIEPCQSGFDCQFDLHCQNPVAGTCAHDVCTTGARLTSGCNSCVTAVCASIASCCSAAGTWGASCVAKAEEICSVDCKASAPAGKCVPYDPGFFNTQCNLPDYTVAPPCAKRVPVCNRGAVEAPAGVKVYLYPANSQQYPSCTPNLQQAQGSCSTTVPIPPGQCRMIENCPIGNENNVTLVVNPAEATQKPECSCQNNWSLYDKGQVCGDAACASAVSEATLSPLAMMVMLDRSGSMGSSIGGGQTRWSASTAALKAFFQDAGSADIRPALHYFPLGACGSTSCASTGCATPTVNANPLLAVTGAGDAQETALVNSLNTIGYGGSTPTLPALQGSIAWAVNYQSTHPGEKAIVVLVTDGEPNGCSSTVATVQSAAAAGLAQGIKTYVIGVSGVATSTINAWATAGGGQAFFVSGTSITQQFLAAMQSIRAQSASCDLTWAPGSTFDPTKASVIYTPGGGAPVTLTKQTNAGACGAQAGWYFDNNTTPTKITLCPTTCNAVKADTGAKVQLSIGCPLIYEPKTYNQVYEGKCGVGQRVEWKILTYDTLTPDDSKVTFSVRTADTQANLSAATFVQAAVASAANNNMTCTTTGPAPQCPVNLYTKLNGKPLASNSFLELKMDLTPSTNKMGAPALKSWDVTYSCPYTE